MEHPLNIYITAHTLISSLGFGTEENLKAIRTYRSGVHLQEAGPDSESNRISDTPIQAGLIDSAELEKRTRQAQIEAYPLGATVHTHHTGDTFPVGSQSPQTGLCPVTFYNQRKYRLVGRQSCLPWKNG